MATAVFQKHHPSSTGAPPAFADILVVHTLASLIAQRSAAIVGASVYALWALKAETEQELLQEFESAGTAAAAGDNDAAVVRRKIKDHADNARAELAIVQARTVVAFNGSVIEQYPHYLEQCQTVIDSLLALSSPSAVSANDNATNGDSNKQKQQVAVGTIDLVPAKESSLLGAAVALACLGA